MTDPAQPPAPPAPEAPADATAPRPPQLSTGKKLGFLAVITIVLLALGELALWPFVPKDFVGPSAATHDPYYGKRLRANYDGPVTANGITYHFSTNSLGHRGPEPAGDLSGVVLLLGDSFTMGDTVDDGEEFAALLRDRIDAPIVNTGMAGTGQGRWLKLLRRDAGAMSPRVVVMQFCANDFRDVHASGLFELGPDGSIVERPVPPESPFRRLQGAVESLPVVPYLRSYAIAKQTAKNLLTNETAQREAHLAAAPDDDAAESSEYDDLMFALTEACLEECAANGWPVVAITAQFVPGERRDRLRALLDRFGHDLVVMPTKHEAPALHHTGRDDHWNPAGHERVADELTPRIRALLGG